MLFNSIISFGQQFLNVIKYLKKINNEGGEEGGYFKYFINLLMRDMSLIHYLYYFLCIYCIVAFSIDQFNKKLLKILK